MQPIIAILIGGAVGSVLRYACSQGVYSLLGRQFPYGTLTVNVLGSFVMGALFIVFSERHAMDSSLARGILVGGLGAFTTFSTFALDTLLILEQGAWIKALFNIFFNVALCIFAVCLGMLVARAV